MLKLNNNRAGLSLLVLGLSSYLLNAQTLSVHPQAIPFPNQAINSTSSAYGVTILNNQTTTLNISSIQASAPFAETNNCGSSLTPGQSCTVNVTFSPTAKQYYSSTLAITDNFSNSPQTVALTGNGIIAVTISPTQILFPNQAVNSTSSTHPVTLTNNQVTPLAISSIQAGAPFAESNNCGSSVAAGQSCTLTVTFSPTAVKYYSSALTISDNAPSSPQTIAVTGNGIVPVTFAPKEILFPNQGVESTSSPYTITLTNAQPTALSISSIQTTAPFAQTNNCGASLAANQSCTVTVTFSPTSVKYYSSSVTIVDDANTSPQTIPVTGNGITPVKYTPPVGGYYFVNQIVSTSSTPQTVTITNEQPSALTFSSMASSSDYPFTTNCGDGHGGGTLAAGSSCTVQVSFDPQALGKRTTNLVIAENAYGSPITIPLQGTGISGTQSPTVEVTPAAPCLLPSGSQQFTANVVDMTNTSVYWYVDAIRNGNSTVGTISTSGLYTAPPYTGSHVIKDVSQVSSSVSGQATVLVSETPTFEIYPFVASIPTGGQQTFQAQICTVPDSGPVTFTVDNIPGGNSTVGTVSSTGVYSAPAVAGKHTVRVTDSTLNHTSGGVVTVFSTITADFGSRTYINYPVPANLFGTARGESIHNVSDRNLLTAGGLTESRLSAQIPVVYATQTPDWTKVDPIIAAIQAAGQHAMLQMTESPTWLQPTTGTCKGNVYAAPTDVNQWAQIAAAYVAHMDSAFPGVVQDYEIWNEPNATGICATSHLDSYMAIYAAAAPAMKAQAGQDGQTIHVGGPVISGYSSVWLSTLLTTASTAPYVDFVSYHQYIYGSTELPAQWDTYTGNPSVYEETQDPSIGATAIYNKVLAQTAAGKQPGGAQTPIYVTEFNTNWAFLADCCRNSPTYAPVWNALYTTDMLNSVYNGSLNMPTKLLYFAGQAYPYFCMIGVEDSNMDCLYSTGATPVPYPQYYPYQLIAGSDYLGLSAGGYMAKSISTPTGGGGLATTAFYTSTQDAIVITNPTATSYSQISVTLANPGFSTSQGTLYTIENGSQINSTPVSFSAQGGNLTTTIEVPPYSVQAISVK